MPFQNLGNSEFLTISNKFINTKFDCRLLWKGTDIDNKDDSKKRNKHTVSIP